jgi:lipopolysaccharide biosynthesis protein
MGGDFIGGTIFWVRYDVLEKYLTNDNIDITLKNMQNGYVLEPSPQHAMERIFGYMVTNENKKIMAIN